MMKYKLINKKTSKEVGVYNSLADAENEVVKQCFEVILIPPYSGELKL